MTGMFKAVQIDNLLILRSSLIESFGGLRHAFSTRIGGVSPAPWDSLNLGLDTGDSRDNVAKNRALFTAILNATPAQLACGQQVHGDTIALVEHPGLYPASDGLITRKKNIVLAIKTADCVPLLLFDPMQKIIAIIHCGWRSVRGNIISNAAEMLTNVHSTKISSVYCAIGPSIRSCCYEIHADVAGQFSKEFIIRRDGRLFLDLIEVIKSRLLAAGVPEQNIDLSEHCTCCEKELFFSYRRDGRRSGRMMLAAMIE